MNRLGNPRSEAASLVAWLGKHLKFKYVQGQAEGIFSWKEFGDFGDIRGS